MKAFTISRRKAILGVACGALALLYLEGLRIGLGAPFRWPGLLERAGLIAASLILARLAQPAQALSGQSNHQAPACMWPAFSALMLIAGLLAGAATWVFDSTPAAWVMLAILLAFLLDVSFCFEARDHFWRNRATDILLAGAAGACTAVLSMWETRFSEEEFYSLVQIAALAVLWLLLRLAWGQISQPSISERMKGFRLTMRSLLFALLILVASGGAGALQAYRHSFFPADAPTYPGISAASPFVCGEGSPVKVEYTGSEVFQKMISLVAASPQKSAPDEAFLALATGDQVHAQAFRQMLLKEARQGRFTGPSGSVKYGQYEASLRVYFYAQIRRSFKDLFNPGETDELRAWFARINRRALTVEWVDGFYALAFSKWPQGPYENQENGAGLLALLETEGLADPSLSPQNQAYLRGNPRGWNERFRNSDDAVIYQPEWINNALFQSLYQGNPNSENERLSFEWLLDQAIPGGRAPGYNHPDPVSFAGIAYLGAGLLQDGRYLWLAGQALDELQLEGGSLEAQPGMEKLVDLAGSSPSVGSCLMYGNTGLPNQMGPLGPDKIVFRDGWETDSTYLLLNLRFTGWHRYKATNTITVIDQDGPLAIEKMSGEKLPLLPTGRSLVRDKRIERENLNGLVIGRTGLDGALSILLSLGSPWAQDPPFFATVENFRTNPGADESTTLISNWHGWQHRRRVIFYPKGPVVIVDTASGPAGRPAALLWHVPGNPPEQDGRVILRTGDEAAEMILLPMSGGNLTIDDESGSQPAERVQFNGDGTGKLALATVFLTGQWTGATASLERQGQNTIIHLVHGSENIQLPIEVP